MNEHISPKAVVPEQGVTRGFKTTAIRLLKVATIVAETLLVSSALATNSWEILALSHLGIIAILTTVLTTLALAGVDSDDLPTFVLLTFAGGPVGGAAALLSDQKIWRSKAADLQQWYDTIAPEHAPAVTLVDRILDGRLIRQQSRLPRPYDALLNSGTMQEKQALLAYLAIDDDEKFVGVALALALRSNDQRVRVQAAAVAAHTRSRNRARPVKGEHGDAAVRTFVRRQGA